MNTIIANTVFAMPDREQADEALAEHEELLLGHLARATEFGGEHLGVFVRDGELWGVSRWSSAEDYERYLAEELPRITEAIRAAGLSPLDKVILTQVLAVPMAA